MPTQEQIEWFLKSATTHGLGFVGLAALVAIVGYGCWRILLLGLEFLGGIVRHVVSIFGSVAEWAPKIGQKHWTLMDKLETSSETTSKALQTLSETHDESAVHHAKIRSALSHAMLGHQAGTENFEAKGHYGEALRNLGPPRIEADP